MPKQVFGFCLRERDGKVCGKPSRCPNGKTCNACYNRVWREKRPERDREIKQAYRDRNPGRTKELWDAYYAKNRTERLLASAIYRHENAEKVKAYERKRYAARRVARAGVPSGGKPVAS